MALAFVDYHRFTAINYKLSLLDIPVGSAMLVAEANGIAKQGHVRAKITELITYTETVRGLSELASIGSTATGGNDIHMPDPLAVNMAKYHLAHGYSGAMATVLDLAGGLPVTGPGGHDWESPDTRKVLEMYFGAAVPAQQRLAILNLIGTVVRSSGVS